MTEPTAQPPCRRQHVDAGDDEREHYVTLLDGAFLPQGLALAQSLARHGGRHTLWVLCVDDVAFDALTALAPANVRPLRLSEQETPTLLALKQERTRQEYCWTLTPFAPRFVFDREPTATRVTYVDADLWFLRSPQPVFDELERSGKSVLITEHAYTPEFASGALTSGTYCVQFMVFTRGDGELVRQWWEDRCVEWCYARYEDGKFGDQRYLDDWPSRFPAQVHVLAERGWALAPWNARRFASTDAVFFHFHGLRLLSEARVSIGGYPVPRRLRRRIYAPYVRALLGAVATLKGVAPIQFRQRDLRGAARAIAVRTIFQLRTLWGRSTHILSER